ncbi:MAG: type II toxin-antitoxin system HipA family toxin [Bacteroidia bacterium]
MLHSEIIYCPGTLAEGWDTYSSSCLKRVFNGHKVSHILPYNAPASSDDADELFLENRTHASISGVQEKFSVLLEKNKLRLADEGEKGIYILKPIPSFGKNAHQMPANEHLTMQLARQVYGIETAENALIFFTNGEPAYITKRFDVKEEGSKWAQDDFASLAGRTPQTHGEHYKYKGNYLELFEIMQAYLPAYKSEAPKLFRLLLFNYLFSNGDAHVKNFSVIETPLGDYRLSPAYDLLNSRIHIADNDFALEEGLLPPKLSQGNILTQFKLLAEKAGMKEKQVISILQLMLSKTDQVASLIAASFLSDQIKRNYMQAYQTRLNKLMR